MNYIWFIIGAIVVIGIVIGLIRFFKNDNDFDPDKLSARDRWRWEKGGID